jgi:hypothetical protein
MEQKAIDEIQEELDVLINKASSLGVELLYFLREDDRLQNSEDYRLNFNCGPILALGMTRFIEKCAVSMTPEE